MALSVHQPSFDTAKRRTRRHPPGTRRPRPQSRAGGSGVQRQLLLPLDDQCFCRFRSSWIENQQPRSRAITAERRDDLRRESCRSCGHVFSSRTSAPGGSSWTGARRGTRRAPAPRVGVAVGLPRAARSPPAPGGPPSPSPSPRARVVLPTRCAPRGAKPAGPSPPVTPTPTGSGPARAIPESGGPPRPVSVVDGRDAPSRPGRKAHNCHPSRGAGGVSPEGP